MTARLTHRWRPRHLSPMSNARPLCIASLMLCACVAARADTKVETIVQKPEHSQPTSRGLRSSDRSGAVDFDRKVARYAIEARYDEEKQRIIGHVKLRWRNRSTQSIDRIPLHTYLNAFSRTDTEWMRSSGGSHRKANADLDALGFMHLRSVHFEDANAPPPAATALGTPGETPDIGLDWEYSEDPSFVWVELPDTVGPGDQFDLRIEFEAQLPRVFCRTGFSDDFVMAGQWFPKPAVLSDDGWEHEPFSYNGEFFADFADFDVWLDLPQTFVVTGTGFDDGAEMRDPSEPGRAWHHRRAAMVHDFAWSAAKSWRSFSAQVDDIEIEAYIAPEFAEQGAEHLGIQVEAMRAMQERYGPYPWRTLSFVLPPSHAKGAQGMEYPTFFATSPNPNQDLPAWLFASRWSGTFTTVHEFGHQYFQGLLASHEEREPWLDEGINTASNILILDDIYGRNAWAMRLLGHEVSMENLLRYMLTSPRPNDVVASPSRHFQAAPYTFSRTVYDRPALALLSLRRFCGEELFDSVWRSYVETYRFTHPTGDDFRRHFADALSGSCLPNSTYTPVEGQTLRALDIDRYFEQTLDQAFSLDVTARIFSSHDVPPARGWVIPQSAADVEGEIAEPTWDPGAADSEVTYEQFVVVYREGNVTVPVTIELEYQDGHKQRYVWYADSSYARIRVAYDKKDNGVRRVIVDPDDQIGFERFRTNNIILQRDERPRVDESYFRDRPAQTLKAIQYALWGVIQ